MKTDKMTSIGMLVTRSGREGMRLISHDVKVSAHGGWIEEA